MKWKFLPQTEETGSSEVVVGANVDGPLAGDRFQCPFFCGSCWMWCMSQAWHWRPTPIIRLECCARSVMKNFVHVIMPMHLG